MQDEVRIEKAKNTIDIYPLKKGKRILVYLADLFVTFILSLILFHLAVYPLSTLMTNKKGRAEELLTAQNQRDSVLYGHKLMVSVTSTDVSHLDENLKKTGDNFIQYYVIPGTEIVNEVFNAFYRGIRGSEEGYLRLFKDNNSKGFFEIVDGLPQLKSEYKEEFTPYFNEKDKMSKKGETDFNSCFETFFLKSYSDLISDIMNNDLVYEGISYKERQTKVLSILNYNQMEILIDVFISYILSFGFLYLLIPLLNKTRKTTAMLFMRVQRVNAHSLRILTRGQELLHSIYQFALNIAFIVFTPLPLLQFNELFSLPVVLPISLISLGFGLVSLVFLLFDAYNRSLSDRLTGSVMITNDALDDIYRSRGYLQ